MTMSMRTLNNANVNEEDTMTMEANFQVFATITPSRQTAVDQDHFPPNGECHQSSEWRGDQRVLGVVFEDDVRCSFPLLLPG